MHQCMCTPFIHTFAFHSCMLPSFYRYHRELLSENKKTKVQFVTMLCLHTGMTLRSLGVELHCRCIQTESRPIVRHIEKVELIPANSHCEETEIIATLKKTGQEVCLDPEAPWVKRLVDRIMSSKSR
ncbi:interleukin-8-like isoform X1 [Genypterus blacodes]|uniref:interleukin-8-like isoform X1 n=1 Tax=Genypterus blacodes TaxID=154954 RepID=UPI003F773506